MQSILVNSSRITEQLALEQEYQKHTQFYVIQSNANTENFCTIIGTIAREVFDHQFYKNQAVRKIQELIVNIVQKRQLSLDLVREIYQEIQATHQKLKEYQQYQKQMHGIFLQDEDNLQFSIGQIDQLNYSDDLKNKIETISNFQQYSESMIVNIENLDGQVNDIDLSLTQKGKLLSEQIKNECYNNVDFGQYLEDQITESTREIANRQHQIEMSQKTYKVHVRKDTQEIFSQCSKSSMILSSKNQSTTPSSRLEIRETNIYEFSINKKEFIKQQIRNSNAQVDNLSQKTVKPKGPKKANPLGYNPKTKKFNFNIFNQTQLTQSSPTKSIEQKQYQKNKQQRLLQSDVTVLQQLQKSDSSMQLRDLKKKVRPSVLNDTSISNIKQIIKKEHQQDVKKCIQKKIQFDQSGPIKCVNYQQQLKNIRLRHKLNTKKAYNKIKN